MIVYKQIIWQYIFKLNKIKRLEEKIRKRQETKERYTKWRKVNINKNKDFCKEFEKVMEIDNNEKEMETTKNKA